MEFLPLSFSELLCLQVLLFLIFLTVHFIVLAGNTINFMAGVTEPSRPPTLFSLCQLSVTALFYTLAVVPKALFSPTVAGGNTTSFTGWAAQMRLFAARGGAERFLLLATATPVMLPYVTHFAVFL